MIIGNALKFHGEEPPMIKVSSRRLGGEWEITVKDSGIGIDGKFHCQIFPRPSSPITSFPPSSF